MTSPTSDGYYIPTDPAVFKRWHDNVTFDHELYWQQRQSTVLSDDMARQQREVQAMLTKLAATLKCNIDQVADRCNKLVEDIEEAKDKLSQ